jgi:hypothetical protein
MDIHSQTVVEIDKAKEARRLLDLDVKEVSLVDRPANLKEFLVVKRLEHGGKQMSAFAADTENKGAENPNPETETEVVKMTDADDGANGDASADAGDAGEAEGGDAEGTGEAEGGDAEGTTETEVEKAIPKEITASIKSIRDFMAKANPVDKGMLANTLQKAFGKAPTKKTETKKSDEPAAPVPAVQVMDDGSVLVSGTPVQKAKGFTTQRTDAIKSVVSNLVGLLGDVDTEVAKALVADLNKAIPKTSKAAPVAKSEDGEDSNADPVDVAAIVQAAVEKAIAPVAERVEKIEKARAPSKSVDGDGKTDSTVDVQKDAGGIWKGVL